MVSAPGRKQRLAGVVRLPDRFTGAQTRRRLPPPGPPACAALARGQSPRWTPPAADTGLRAGCGQADRCVLNIGMIRVVAAVAQARSRGQPRSDDSSTGFPSAELGRSRVWWGPPGGGCPVAPAPASGGGGGGGGSGRAPCSPVEAISPSSCSRAAFSACRPDTSPCRRSVCSFLLRHGEAAGGGCGGGEWGGPGSKARRSGCIFPSGGSRPWRQNARPATQRRATAAGQAPALTGSTTPGRPCGSVRAARPPPPPGC